MVPMVHAVSSINKGVDIIFGHMDHYTRVRNFLDVLEQHVAEKNIYRELDGPSTKKQGNPFIYADSSLVFWSTLVHI